MLRRQGIKKLGLAEGEQLHSIIFLNEELLRQQQRGFLSRVLETTKIVFHEVGHGFSSFSGVKNKEFTEADAAIKSLLSKDGITFEEVAQSQINMLKHHAFEEARADSISHAFLKRTKLSPFAEKTIDLSGYANLNGGFSRYYGRYSETRNTLLNRAADALDNNGVPPDVVDTLMGEQAKRIEQLSLVEAQGAYHGSLATVGEYADRVKSIQLEKFSQAAEKISTGTSGMMPHYTRVMTEATKRNTSIDISGQRVASSSHFAEAVSEFLEQKTIDRSGEIAAQELLSEPVSKVPYAGPIAASEASETLRASISSVENMGAAAIDDAAKSVIPTKGLLGRSISRGIRKEASSARTTSKIIEGVKTAMNIVSKVK